MNPNKGAYIDDDNDSVEIELQDEEDFIHNTMNPNNAGKRQILNQPVHHRQASREIEYIELDMFDAYEDKLASFLKSTPYIDQLIQTSKEYRMFIDSLKILASFNEELANVLLRVKDLHKKGKDIRISKVKGHNILRKNRELRVQLKSLISDNGVNTSTSGINSKSQNSKRALIKERDKLLKKNNDLMFKFKKAFLL